MTLSVHFLSLSSVIHCFLTEQVNMSCDLKGPQDIMVNQPQSFPLTKPSKGKWAFVFEL